MTMGNRGCLIALTLSLTVTGIGGCMGILNDDLLTDGDAPGADILNALTAGDLAAGFESFRDGLSADAPRESGAGITAEVRAQIEQLQSRFDAGEITQTEFSAAVGEVLQDTEPASPFAGFRFLGSPFSTAGINDFAAVLGLSETQQQQALQLYRVLHADIAEVRAAARTQIRTVLSAQQQSRLEQVAQEFVEQVEVGDEPQPAAQLVFDVLVQRLDLTPDQQTQISEIQEFLRGVIADLHSETRAEFLQLLDESQAPLLDFIKSS